MGECRRLVLITGLLAGLATAGRAQDVPAPVPAMPAMKESLPPAKKAVVSATLTVTVEGKTQTFSAQRLGAMPQRTVTVHNGHTLQDEVYTGVGVDTLLARFGLTLENGGAPKVYHSYVRAEGTDHFFVIDSAAELEPALHTGDSIVALTRNGKPLGSEGQFKLILAGDKKPARWVRNLASLTVVTVR